MVKILLFLLLFFLPTQLGKHFWFGFSYELGQRVDYLSPTIYFTDILIGLIIISFLIQNSKFKIQNCNLKLKIKNFIQSLYYLFVIPAKATYTLLRKCYVAKATYTLLRKCYVAKAGIYKDKKVILNSFQDLYRFRIHAKGRAGKSGMTRCVIFPIVILFIVYWLFVIKQNPFLLAYNLGRLGEFGLLGIVIAKTFKKEDFPRIIEFLNLALFLQIALVVYQFSTGKTFGLWLFGERSFSISTPGIAKFIAPSGRYLLRGYGTFPHPNVLAGFCLFLLIANSFLFLFNRHPERSEGSPTSSIKGWDSSSRYYIGTQNDAGLTFYLISFIFSLLGIWLSFSLLAIVLSQVFLLSLGIVFLRKIRGIRGLVGRSFLLSSFLIIIFISSFFIFNFPDESFSRRLTLLQTAWDMFKRSPLFGVGLGNFIPSMPNKPIGRTYFWQPVHNIVALVGAETGLVGLAIVSLLIWKVLQKLKVNPSSTESRRGRESQKLKITPNKFLRNFTGQAIQNSKFKSLATPAKGWSASGGNYQLLTTNYLILIGWWLVVLVSGMFDHYWLTLQQGRLMLTLLVGLSFVRSLPR